MKSKLIKDRLVKPIVRRVPFSLLQRIGSCSVVVVYYHVVSDAPVAHVSHLYDYKNVFQFSEDLDFLLRQYSPASLDDVISWSRGATLPKQDCFLVTFDDGFRECAEVAAPILLAKGVPATFFLPSAFLDNRELCYEHKASLLAEEAGAGLSASAEREIRRILASRGFPLSGIAEGILDVDYRRKATLDVIAEVLLFDFRTYLERERPYLATEQVQWLISKGFTIGAHSIDHPYYADIAPAEQVRQTVESTREIRDRFELGYGAFAFPHNDAGVSEEFFPTVRRNGLVDITFGTGGMQSGGAVGHLQRVSLELPVLPARDILAWQYGRRVFRQLRGATG